MTEVLVLQGPNLNLLGRRDRTIYGTATLADVEQLCRDEAARLGLAVDFRQSNHGFGIVAQYAVVAGKAELEAAAQCESVDRRRERLAARFQATHQP